jgi:hypothetical protein
VPLPRLIAHRGDRTDALCDERFPRTLQSETIVAPHGAYVKRTRGNLVPASAALLLAAPYNNASIIMCERSRDRTDLECWEQAPETGRGARPELMPLAVAGFASAYYTTMYTTKPDTVQLSYLRCGRCSVHCNKHHQQNVADL